MGSTNIRFCATVEIRPPLLNWSKHLAQDGPHGGMSTHQVWKGMLYNLDLLWTARYRLAPPFVYSLSPPSPASGPGNGSLAQPGPGPGSLPSHPPSGNAGRSGHPLESISS
eukprot:11142336-Heterocapsa_arctica.AAC.1